MATRDGAGPQGWQQQEAISAHEGAGSGIFPKPTASSGLLRAAWRERSPSWGDTAKPLQSSREGTRRTNTLASLSSHPTVLSPANASH